MESPSGKYYIVNTSSSVTDNYVRLYLYNKHLRNPIADTVHHPGRHYNFVVIGEKEYLITNTTIIDCETRNKWNHPDADSNPDFIKWQVAPDGKTLIGWLYVDGIFNEYIFYDFNPEKGTSKLLFDQSKHRLDCSEDSSFTFRQGKEITEKIELDPEEWYYVYICPKEYNTKAGEYQVVVHLYKDVARQLLPLDVIIKLDAFEQEWNFQREGYWEARSKLDKELDVYLDKDVIIVNYQEAVLQRKEDTIIFLLYREFNPV